MASRKKEVLSAEWLAAQPTDPCRCTHTAEVHHKGKACTFSDPKTFKFCGCAGYHPGTVAVEGHGAATEDTDMAKAKGGKKAKKAAKKATGTKGPRTLMITRYVTTAKEAPEVLTNTDKTTLTAILYRTMHAHKGGMTSAEFLEAITPTQRKAYENNLQSTLFALRKAGYLKAEKSREEVAA